MNKTTISAFLILVSIFSISCDGDDTENTPLFDARRISQFDINSDFSEDPLYTFRYSYNQQEDIDSINFEIQGLVRSSFKYVYNSNFRLEKVELTTYGFDGSQRLSTIYGYEYEVQESRPARITISSASSPDVIFRYLRFEYAQTDLVRLEWYESDFTTGTDRLISSTDYEYFQERLLSLNNIPTTTINTINPFFYNERVVAMEFFDLSNVLALNLLSPSFKFFVTSLNFDEDPYTLTPEGLVGSMPATASDSTYTYVFNYVEE